MLIISSVRMSASLRFIDFHSMQSGRAFASFVCKRLITKFKRKNKPIGLFVSLSVLLAMVLLANHMQKNSIYDWAWTKWNKSACIWVQILWSGLLLGIAVVASKNAGSSRSSISIRSLCLFVFPRSVIFEWFIHFTWYWS